MTINLKGGLGNQLFQLFSLMGISKKNNYKYLIDKKYESDRKTYWDTILASLPNCDNSLESISKNNNSEIFIVNEQRFSQYSDFELDNKIYPNVLLNGYFQSFFYFEQIRDFVFDTLITKQDKNIMETVNSIYNEIKNKYTNKKMVFIHRRTGDFNDEKHNGYFPILSIDDYYKKAISQFNQDDCVFIIFSNEPVPTIEEFNFLKNKEFVIQEDYIEFLLMTKMDAAVLSNSTFSIWAAYLMDYYRNKKIICPKYWFREWDIHRLDFFENHWIFIENHDVYKNVSFDPCRK